MSLLLVSLISQKNLFPLRKLKHFSIAKKKFVAIFFLIAGNFVYAINGPTSQIIPVRGFTIDPMTEQIIDHWGGFENPHTIAICPNGSAMYVGEIGPNRLTKFTLQDVSSPN